MIPESVTHVLTSYVARGSFRFALLTLVNDIGKPVTLGPKSISNLAEALRTLDLATIDAVALTGSGKTFCAGADLRKMSEASNQEQAEHVARQGLKCLSELAALPVPTFAFLNGVALGGGLELALHADHRTVASRDTVLGFPEVRLGLIPGWGGIRRAADLLGAGPSAKLMILDSLAGKNLSADAALKLGLVDAVLPAPDFLRSSLDFAVSVLSGVVSPVRAPGKTSEWKELITVQEQLDRKVHGAAPAAYRALELLLAEFRALPGPVLESEDATIRVFGELLLSDQARAGMYAQHLTQSLARRPVGQPDAQAQSIGQVGVVGAGLMASQLALLFARRLKVPVLLTDLSNERLTSAMGWIDGQLAKEVQSGRLDRDTASGVRDLIKATTDKADFAACDVVIEAVFEDLGVKREVFAQLESILRPNALILTNTSALSVEELGTHMVNPARLAGLHFFNPVAALPLVEIISTPQTDGISLATAFDITKRLGKTAVFVGDSPGFVVNRILARLFCEVLSLIDRGLDPRTVDHALDPLGLPMTPLTLLQFIGPTVQLRICRRMHEAYPDRFASTLSLEAIVDAGLPGYLDPRGFVSAAAENILPAPLPADPAAVRSRILAGLADEVAIMLREGVVPGPEQIDLCMILGANYPFHTGGLTPLLDRTTGSSYHPDLRGTAGTAEQSASKVGTH
ncbi:3-hydroxyacyl-CoA dehydrogenase NAD-binding domain-containing protein [Arthrobacter sp. MI7-26]|uniref:3-hydroxyacyl-CoA dehydrogenase NAD-binding domain-containing protein n=1 Tax=Arthrobacter sp. MI7-26 TaxID=2993653 RepID=UPI00224932A1|nr:3-hydroxyacyl-CoA dehydrogenase NAD-binding domain-containing protein [Arthrobacter sp. MI7-26]MCX2746838.1 3-hydroxyacyl-CoA dehydrogenase NAD-binding domain-containing protein [Arthrobacter sp. MI7-26]